jgi:hypothetical protein
MIKQGRSAKKQNSNPKTHIMTNFSNHNDLNLFSNMCTGLHSCCFGHSFIGFCGLFGFWCLVLGILDNVRRMIVLTMPSDEKVQQ